MTKQLLDYYTPKYLSYDDKMVLIEMLADWYYPAY